MRYLILFLLFIPVVLAGSVERTDTWYVTGTANHTNRPPVTIMGTIGGGEPAQTATHTITLPAGITADELLVVFFRTAGNNVNHNIPGDWTELSTRASQGRTTILYRVADGTEGNIITIGSAAARRSAYTSYRIRHVYNETPIAGAIAGAQTVDPPSLNPGWTANDILWIAMANTRRTDNTLAAPASYQGTVSGDSGDGVGSTDYARLATAHRTHYTTSEDPGALSTTGTTNQPHAATVAIRPIGINKSTPTNALLNDTQDTAENHVDILVENNTLYHVLNASVVQPKTVLVTTGDVTTFTAYVTIGIGVNEAYATASVFVDGTLICKDGDDGTGGTLLTNDTIITMSCTPGSDTTILQGKNLTYHMSVWAENITEGPKKERSIQVRWDTHTANTTLTIMSNSPLSISVKTDETNYVQGEEVKVTGLFDEYGGMGISSNVTVTIRNPDNTIVQQRNVTSTNGTYEDNYTIALDATTGMWTVAVTGWYDEHTTISNMTTFTVDELVAPRIQNIQVIAGQTSANITWETDVPANGTVHYGTTPAFGAHENNSSESTSHQFIITNLLAGTQYYVRVTSCDAIGCSQSETRTFTTQPPEGRCVARYVETGAQHIAGRISDGDIIKIECRLPAPLGERADVTIRARWTHSETRIITTTPRLFANEREVLYP